MTYILHGDDITNIMLVFLNDIYDAIQQLNDENITNPLKVARILCVEQFAYRFPQALLLCQLVPTTNAGRVARILIDVYDTLDQEDTSIIVTMATNMFVLLNITIPVNIP